jgi:hypothetical protein
MAEIGHNTKVYVEQDGAVLAVERTGAVKFDSMAISAVKWIDVTCSATLLDGALSVVVIAGSALAQYKVRDVILVGGGTSFGAAGNRLLDLTDGTTVYTTIANADLESAPAASLRLGDAKVPFLTGKSNVKTVAGASLVMKYSGGTTDHTTGSIVFSVCVEKTD